MPTKRYSIGAMILHWAIAIAVIWDWRLAEAAEHAPRGQHFAVLQPHFALGMLILVLTILRLLWRLTHKPPPFASDLAAWERWLAPLRPGGSALVLKALPLACALPGVWRRKLYTLQWASMLVLLYVAEGIVRGMTDGGLSARLGWVEVAAATLFIGCALAYLAPFKRAARTARREAAKSIDAGDTSKTGDTGLRRRS